MIIGLSIGVISSSIFHILTPDMSNFQRELSVKEVRKLNKLYSLYISYHQSNLKEIFRYLLIFYLKEEPLLSSQYSPCLSGTHKFRRQYSLPKRRLSTISIGRSYRRMSTYGLSSLPNYYVGVGSLCINEEEQKPMKPIDWFKNFEFYLVSLCYMASRSLYMVLISYLVYYVEYTLLLEQKMNAIAPLVMFTSGFFATAMVEAIKKHVSIKIVFVFCNILGIGKYNHEYGSYYLYYIIIIFIYFCILTFIIHLFVFVIS